MEVFHWLVVSHVFNFSAPICIAINGSLIITFLLLFSITSYFSTFYCKLGKFHLCIFIFLCFSVKCFHFNYILCRMCIIKGEYKLEKTLLLLKPIRVYLFNGFYSVLKKFSLKCIP